jgi:3-deoxy-manno-octulosonate cytidylyltransferase (CMP-KDO synthetase)
MSQRPTVAAIIPSRYASTRLPAKPLVDLCGKPMVQRVVEQARRARLVDRVIVATDHEAIAAAVRAFGGEAVMTAPELPSGSDRIAAVARTLSADIIVNVQGDEPLIAPEMIDQAIAPLLADPAILSGTIVRPIDTAEDVHNPNVVKAVLDAQGFALYFSRSPIPYQRDESPDTWHLRHRYYKHFGLYVYRRAFLLEYASWPATPLELSEKLEQLRILERGYRMKAAVTDFDSIPVDTAADADRVRAILLRHQKTEQP